jgi:hypothetical protein
MPYRGWSTTGACEISFHWLCWVCCLCVPCVALVGEEREERAAIRFGDPKVKDGTLR